VLFFDYYLAVDNIIGRLLNFGPHDLEVSSVYYNAPHNSVLSKIEMIPNNTMGSVFQALDICLVIKCSRQLNQQFDQPLRNTKPVAP
jgi:hypothetical protein